MRKKNNQRVRKIHCGSDDRSNYLSEFSGTEQSLFVNVLLGGLVAAEFVEGVEKTRTGRACTSNVTNIRISEKLCE